jgi:hypothetical protein
VLFIFATIALLGWGSSVLLFRRRHALLLSGSQVAFIASCYAGAILLSIVTWRVSMTMGVRALEEMESA